METDIHLRNCLSEAVANASHFGIDKRRSTGNRNSNSLNEEATDETTWEKTGS